MTDLTARPPMQSGPMPFLMLLDEAMRRTRRYFGAIFPAVGIPLALLAGATGVLQALWFEDMTRGTFLGNPFRIYEANEATAERFRALKGQTVTVNAKLDRVAFLGSGNLLVRFSLTDIYIGGVRTRPESK